MLSGLGFIYPSVIDTIIILENFQGVQATFALGLIAPSLYFNSRIKTLDWLAEC